MAITQTVKIPANRRLTVKVPREVLLGNVILTFTPASSTVDGDTSAKERIGFMKGQISVPPDFDTMGQAEIALLFGETP